MDAKSYLRKLIREAINEIQKDENWKKWVASMVLTVEESLREYEYDIPTDSGTAYDIIKTNFRADSPNDDMFQQACKEAITELKRKKIVV